MLKVKALILHIGSWKTGTTTIQAFLSQNKKQLVDQGFLYPITGRGGSGADANAHHELSELFSAADGVMTRDIKIALDQIAAELDNSRCHTLILSSETFMAMRRPESLARYINPDVVTIVASFRHQAEFINSMYYTDVCHLKVIDEPMRYLEAFDRQRFDYPKILDRWAAVWPGSDLRVSLFFRGSPAHAFPAKYFAAQAGIDIETLNVENRVLHATQSADATSILRQLAESGISDAGFYDIFKAFEIHRSLFEASTLSFPPQVMRDIEEEFNDSNRELERYLRFEPRTFPGLQLPSDDEWRSAQAASHGTLAAFFKTTAARAAKKLNRSGDYN